MPADAFASEESRKWSLDDIEQDVIEGLSCDGDRLTRAAKADDYYQLRNEKHDCDLKRPDEDQEDFAKRPKEYSWLTQAVVDKLSEPLYDPGPSRTWDGDNEANAWLENVYRDTTVNNRLASADRSAMLGHVAMIQVEPTGDVNRPIRYWLWKPHEFVVFTRDGDPVTPWAVCTIEQIPAPGKRGQMVTRYRLWSAWERRTYLSEPYGKGQPWGQKAKRVADDEGLGGKSPYPGVLPFVFVRNKPADSAFWEGGIGDALVHLNQSIDKKQSNLSHHVDLFLHPQPWLKNVPADFRPTIKPGVPLSLPSMPSAKIGDVSAEPEIAYLQPTLNVEAGWYFIRSRADAGMEELQIPLTIVRNDSSTDLSGVAIMYKTVPITKFIKARQPRYTEVEVELAAKSFAVSGVWYGDQRHEAIARDPKLSVFWPEPVIPQPTPERNEADAWEMEQGLNDPLAILARRLGLNIDQATEHAKEIAKRRLQWNTIMAAVMQAEMDRAKEAMGKTDSNGSEDQGDGQDSSDNQDRKQPSDQ